MSIFLAYGTTAAVARQLGAGGSRAAIRHWMDGLWLAAAIGLGVPAIAWPLAPQVTRVFGATPGVSHDAVTYLRISLLGAPSMLIVLAGTGVLRGLQDTVTPLITAMAANTANTVAPGSGSAPTWPGCARRRMAAGLLVRTLALQAVRVVTTAVAARQGDAAIAAHQVADRLWMLMALALDAIAIAGQIITGRCLGAGDVAGARAATRRMARPGRAVAGLQPLAAGQVCHAGPAGTDQRLAGDGGQPCQVTRPEQAQAGLARLNSAAARLPNRRIS